MAINIELPVEEHITRVVIERVAFVDHVRLKMELSNDLPGPVLLFSFYPEHTSHFGIHIGRISSKMLGEYGTSKKRI